MAAVPIIGSVDKSPQQRMEKGAGIMDLAKLLKVYGREHSLDGLGAEAALVLDERVLVSNWYPLQAVWEMLDFTYARMLARSPRRAIELGAMGGKGLWAGTHRVMLREDPVAGLLAMGPSWEAYFNFGLLTVEPERGGRAVRFTIAGYPDAPEVHSMTIAGWHLAAARLCGAPEAQAEVIRQPSRGDRELVHRIYW